MRAPGLAAILVFAVIVLLSVAGLSQPHERKPAHKPRMSYLDNGTIRVGVDLNLGGAITYLSPSKEDRNIVNSWDWGRQIQMSHYSGPVPYTVGTKRPARHWEHLGWNPVQAGDDYGHPSRVLEHRNDDKTLHVKSVPMQWPLDNEPAECVFETWLTLDGSTVRVRCGMTNQRSDKTQYPARTQELPAVYTNGPYYRLMSYTGAKPFTDDAVTRIEKKPGSPGPWTTWKATENWAALVNDDDWGLGVWNPGCIRFSGGFAGKPGKGGPHDSPTGYIAPNRVEILDHNIVYEYEYTLILGTLREIRTHIVRNSAKPTPPSWRFAKDRQGWSYVNAHDVGWPIHGELDVRSAKADPQLIAPVGFWMAKDAPTMYLEAALTTAAKEFRVYWATHEQPSFAEQRSLAFPVTSHEEYRTYAIRLGDSTEYRGVITSLRLDPGEAFHPDDRVRIRSIGFTKND